MANIKKSENSQSKHTKETAVSRFPFIDYIRGFAVLLMNIFHFSFDLRMLNYNEIDFQRDLFWWTFPRVIVFFFLFSMGLSMEVTYKEKLDWGKVFKRVGKIGGCALLISAFTYIAFPNRWIYFGTLHCIATCTILAIPFQRRPNASLIVSLALLIPAVFFSFKWPFFTMKHNSMDYIPAIPWIGVVLLGIFAFKHNIHQINLRYFPLKRPLIKMGQHSLFIYLIHQPLLFGSVKLFNLITT